MRPLIIAALTLTTSACSFYPFGHEAQNTRPEWCDQVVASADQKTQVSSKKGKRNHAQTVSYKDGLTMPSKEYINQNCGKDTLPKKS